MSQANEHNGLEETHPAKSPHSGVDLPDIVIDWLGGPCPVAPTTPVRPIYRGPADPAKGIRITFAPAGRLDWSHDGGPDDIIGYEVAPEPSSKEGGQ